jgi:biopolymer transport protein ExbD
VITFEDEKGPDLTPMIDIVFNLLIFFMCASRFRSTEALIRCYLPTGLGPLDGAASVTLNEVRVKLLWLDAAGEPTTDPAAGHAVLAVGTTRLSAIGELDGPGAVRSPAWGALQERLRTLLAAAQGDPLPVIIDARQQVPVQVVVSALNEVVRAEVKEVRFAAPEAPY